ncbi:hypothetical protein J6590_000306 [Homalodisca vitripennis]|nr:hypothetical protein J6590_000306 [Homalodisca vitripennis]
MQGFTNMSGKIGWLNQSVTDFESCSNMMFILHKHGTVRLHSYKKILYFPTRERLRILYYINTYIFVTNKTQCNVAVFNLTFLTPLIIKHSAFAIKVSLLVTIDNRAETDILRLRK